MGVREKERQRYIDQRERYIDQRERKREPQCVKKPKREKERKEWGENLCSCLH